MNLLCTLYVLIKIHYPSDDINVIRYHNQVLNEAMSAYCYWGIEYDIVMDDRKPDLEIYPEVNFIDPNMLGLTLGNIHLNPKLYFSPSIYLNYRLYPWIRPRVLIHEIFHFLGGDHNIDPQSIMYEEYNDGGFTRHDTLTLNKLIKNEKKYD